MKLLILISLLKRFDELETGKYKIKKFEIFETKYGKRLTVHCDDFFVYLPKRFSDAINSSELLNVLNEKAENSDYFMEYNGKDKNRKNLLLLSFY